MPDREVNEIYDDGIIKYTLNIPKDLYLKISKHTGRTTKYGGRKSTYIREVLEQALTDERIPTQQEFEKLSVGEVTRQSFKSKVWWKYYRIKNKVLYNNEPRMDVVGPPKKFHGFRDGLGYWPLLRRWQSKQDRHREYSAKSA